MPSRTRWPNFRRSEFACNCGCEHNDIHGGFIDYLQLLRSVVGEPFIITSGYRCLKHPDEAKKENPGAHYLGLAADIAADAALARRILKYAVPIKHFTGIGICQLPGKRFVHLDIVVDVAYRPRPALWTYPS